MRKDLAKLIYTPGRSKLILKPGREPRYVDLDDVPPGGKESIKKPYREDFGSTGTWFAPVDRFLQRSVGRKWNDVYSDLCSMFKTNRLRRELNQHLHWRVTQNYEFRDGRMVDTQRDFTVTGLYVDSNGVLCKTKDAPSNRAVKDAKAKKRAETIRDISTTFKIVRVHGIWHGLWLEEIPKLYSPHLDDLTNLWRPYSVYDSFLKKRVRGGYQSTMQWNLYLSNSMYCTRFCALSKKQLKQYGVKNVV